MALLNCRLLSWTTPTNGWLAGQDEEQIRWFKFPRAARLDDVHRFISESIESWRTADGHWYWGVRMAGNPSLIGGVDLRDIGNFEFDVSYVIFTTFRNQGFARRASLLALHYAQDILSGRTAVVKMLPGNQYSTRLALNLGATYVDNPPSDAGSEFTVYKLDITDD
ncbi:MAG: GNAT family N-acetyltransferase [Acidimicrobiales bacterium]